MMVIEETPGPSFSVAGDGWRATGTLSNGQGAYDWVFEDGTYGRTMLVLQGGELHGEVRTKTPGGPTWDYVGTRADGGTPASFPCR